MTTQLLNDRYQVIKVLGSGGFGETFLAEDSYMPSKRRCVVKQLKPIQNNPQIYQLVQERFQREAAILESLGGAIDQIPALYAYFIAEGQFYLVQEWIEGDTLTNRILERGLFTEAAVQQLLINILPVLDYVHSQQIVHRDIKPDNIIIRNRDGKPVLIDFGAVRESMGTVVNSQGNPTSSIVIGTPGYMPSEQAAGRPVYSSDLYSLGMTAIYLLTGRQPQNLETDSRTGEIVWRQYAGYLNPIIADVLDQAIAYHPRDRYPTAKDMLNALQNIANHIAPTQPIFHQPPVISNPSAPTVNASPLPTVNVALPPQTTNQTNQNPSNNQNGILIGSLIVGGLIGASIIVGQMLHKSSQPIAEKSGSTLEKPSVSTPNPTVVSSTAPTAPTAPTAQNIAPPTQNPAVVSSTEPTAQNIAPPVQQPVESQEPPPVDPTLNNYAWLFQRPVTEADLENRNGLELDILRNTIFAVYGRRFDTPGLQAYFNQQSWYQPKYSPKAFPSNLLTKLEQRNVDYIAQYQDRYNRRYFRK